MHFSLRGSPWQAIQVEKERPLFRIVQWDDPKLPKINIPLPADQYKSFMPIFTFTKKIQIVKVTMF